MQPHLALALALHLGFGFALGACGRVSSTDRASASTKADDKHCRPKADKRKCKYDRASTVAPFTVIPVNTEPGLSGLAVDASNGIWTVTEQAKLVYRITLDADLRPPPKPEFFEVENLPLDTDLEGIAVLGPDHFALSTESRTRDEATILLAKLVGKKLVVTSKPINLVHKDIEIRRNKGAEGVCGAGDTIVVALERTGKQDGRHWALLVRIEKGEIASTHRMWLTTGRDEIYGKISGLDCQVGTNDTIAGWAVERDFGMTRLLHFELPPRGSRTTDITPTCVQNLSEVLNGVNLEGIAQLTDGRLVAVVDNQYGSISGWSRLLVFPALRLD